MLPVEDQEASLHDISFARRTLHGCTWTLFVLLVAAAGAHGQACNCFQHTDFRFFPRSDFNRSPIAASRAESTNRLGEGWFENTDSSDFNSSASAQNPGAVIRHVVEDQWHIWTSPLRLKPADTVWLVPFGGITAGLIMTDRTASHEATRNSHVNLLQTVSNAGLAAFGGATAGLYLLGWDTGNAQLRETGILGGEAMLDGLMVSEGLKYIFERQRPAEANGAGRFFQLGSQKSFPSGHSTVAFAFASVLAREYPGWLSQAAAYGGAAAIALARVGGRQHFPSDVFVGGASGYLIGRYVYRAHHDRDLDGGEYGTFERAPRPVGLTQAGSSYIELDSWIYPALDRLIALGVIHRPFMGLRPWTRTDAAEMLAAAIPVDQDAGASADTRALYASLRAEFAHELAITEAPGINDSIRLDSIYTAVYPIAGTPLNDSYHFGQSIINDFGRPYQKGFNSFSGVTSRAETGHFFFYFRGEYQHAPGAPPYSLSVRTAIAAMDQNPVQPALPVSEANSFRLLDTYAGVTLFGHEISVGKQSLWWGAGQSSSFIFSNNAEPIYMLRINRTLPLRIPLISRLVGPLRYDNFFGKLSGHQFPPDPFMFGDKVSFQPTENLEFGFSRTAVFAGRGKTPLTFGTFFTSFTSANDVPISDKGTPRDPGARHGAFDWSYRLPFVRNWLTLYGEALAHDEPSPLSAPRRSAILPGIYVSHFPRISRLDFRAESGYTDIPPIRPSQNSGRFVYWELIYHDAYTNKGNLMGSWIGRQGKGTQAWSTYWLSPYSSIQLSWRNAKTSPQFVPGGTTQNDFSIAARLRVRKDLELWSSVQYERWDVPLLSSTRQSDIVTWVQLTFWPKGMMKSRVDPAAGK
ncbi:MAG: phosphatase PAP2 family protein [Acidobacteria bacterium]|nr:phosphatase PAP2 family protein [Acidobacteriota bacterium]